MTVEQGKIVGDYVVSQDLNLHGRITGNVVVQDKTRFEVHGLVDKDLSIESGGEAAIYGTVTGNVYNQGGNLSVYGVIGGNLHKGTGETFVDEQAVVEGQVV